MPDEELIETEEIIDDTDEGSEDLPSAGARGVKDSAAPAPGPVRFDPNDPTHMEIARQSYQMIEDHRRQQQAAPPPQQTGGDPMQDFEANIGEALQHWVLEAQRTGDSTLPLRRAVLAAISGGMGLMEGRLRELEGQIGSKFADISKEKWFAQNPDYIEMADDIAALVDSGVPVSKVKALVDKARGPNRQLNRAQGRQARAYDSGFTEYPAGGSATASLNVDRLREAEKAMEKAIRKGDHEALTKAMLWKK